MISALFLSVDILNESSWSGEGLSSQRDIGCLNITSKGNLFFLIHKAKEKIAFNTERIKIPFRGWRDSSWLRVLAAIAED